MKYRMKHAPMEREVRANADYMAAHLKPYGWEYIVVDIQWYAKNTGSQREKYQYIPFGEVSMDEYGRLLPCTDRFPSAKDGVGFRALADYVHGLAGNSAGSGTPASADFGKRCTGERYSGSVVDL